MREAIEHPLRNVSMRILQDWGMMIAEEVAESECRFDPEKKLFMIAINMEGHLTGTLSILVQEDFMHSLTSNLLGMDFDEVPSIEECEDALREMGNVLAGNYFTEAYGDDVVFDLLNPRVSEVDFHEVDKIAARRVKYFFNADGAPMAITFSIRE